MISATGSEAVEHPQPSRPRMVGFRGDIVLKYLFKETVLSHCNVG